MSLDSISFLNYVGPYIGKIGEEARKRDMETCIDILSKIHFFSSLSHDELVKVANVCTPKTFHDKEYITREGETGQNLEFYIIISGQVRVTKGADIDNTIAVLSSGDFLGEVSLLTGNARNANAVAVGLVDTYAIGRTDFNALIKDQLNKYMGNVTPDLTPYTQKLKPRKLSESKPLEIVQPNHPESRNTMYY